VPKPEKLPDLKNITDEEPNRARRQIMAELARNMPPPGQGTDGRR
jgi:hypothetical protein